MRQYAIILPLLLTACLGKELTQESAHEQVIETSASNRNKELTQESVDEQVIESAAPYRNCEIVDADLTFNNWHTLKSETMGFEMKYPGYVDSELSYRVRIQNYTNCKLEPVMLAAGEYYLSAWKMPKKCEEEYPSLTKVRLPDETVAWQKNTPSGEGMGDKGGNAFTLCFNRESGSTIFSGTESTEEGQLVNQIFSTIKIIDPE